MELTRRKNGGSNRSQPVPLTMWTLVVLSLIATANSKANELRRHKPWSDGFRPISDDLTIYGNVVGFSRFV